jgi:hypothetical protein
MSTPFQVKTPVHLALTITKVGGGTVPLDPVMGAFSHLVAFDEARSGFAHLHPMETDLTRPPSATQPVMRFQILFPRGGTYVIWAQVSLGGREVFEPFRFEVVE